MRRAAKGDLCVYPTGVSGERSLRAFAEQAVGKGLKSIACCLPSDVSAEAVASLRAGYADRLQILLAYEGELPKCETASHFDVRIGEVQTLELSGVIVPFPKTAEEVYAALRYTEGEFLFFLRKCYEALVTLPERTDCDAVRLFDPNALWNRDGRLYDAGDMRYRLVEWRALEALLCQDAVIELCVSSCKQGVLPISYPDTALLRKIGEQCGRVALSSRALCAEAVGGSFSEALAQLRACGIGSVSVRQKDGWEQIPL